MAFDFTGKRVWVTGAGRGIGREVATQFVAAGAIVVGLELAPFGVRANLVSPGSTDTPMLRGMLPSEEAIARTIAGLPEQFKLGIPLRKVATPAEIAHTVLFLASDLASHITLQDLVVDGGATLSA